MNILKNQFKFQLTFFKNNFSLVDFRLQVRFILYIFKIVDESLLLNTSKIQRKILDIKTTDRSGGPKIGYYLFSLPAGVY